LSGGNNETGTIKDVYEEVAIGYGMTETSPISTQTIIGTPLEKQVSTVGTVQDHLKLKSLIQKQVIP
jgi:long-subunit acyl-CoA synthetase (AMP-forming)